MDTGSRQPRNSGGYVGGGLLIAIGLAVLVSNLGGDRFGGSLVVVAVGIAFLVAYAMWRRYGYLVPGGVLTGVGAGILAASLLEVDTGPYAALGGGIGFLLIYAIDLLASGSAARWWPVIPGGLMVVAGSGMASGNQQLITEIGRWSPVLLIALGILILVTRARPSRQ